MIKNDDLRTLSKNWFCRKFTRFWGKNLDWNFHPCKKFDIFHVCLIDVKCYDNHDHVGIDHHRMDVLLPEKAPKVGHSMFLMNVFLSNTLNPLSLPFISISSWYSSWQIHLLLPLGVGSRWILTMRGIRESSWRWCSRNPPNHYSKSSWLSGS